MPAMHRPLRTWIVLALSAVALSTVGQGCPSFLPSPPVVVVPTTVDIELINTTVDPVDPGLFVDNSLVVVDPPLAPGETVQLNFDCFAGTTFQTDGTLLTVVPIASDNVPIAEEGVEFLCGDVVSFLYVDNGVDPFFTRLEVNGNFVSD
jgi:hypothetical protein